MAPRLHRLTATQVLDEYSTGKLTVEQYAESLLRHIVERDNDIKAWAYLNPSQVLDQAKALDKVPRDQRGPLHGVAVAIKDVIYTKGESQRFQTWYKFLTKSKACRLSSTRPSTRMTSPR